MTKVTREQAEIDESDWAVNHYPNPKPLVAPQYPLSKQMDGDELADVLAKQMAYIDYVAYNMTKKSMRELAILLNVIIDGIAADDMRKHLDLN